MALPTKGERHPGSGRKPGTPNKDTKDLLALCESKGLNPFEALIELALNAETDDKKFDRLKEICQYIYPKRKAIEHSTDGENGFKIIVEDYRSK